jgi:hypothetical protein
MFDMRQPTVEEREDLEQVVQDRAVENAERLEWIAEQVCERMRFSDPSTRAMVLPIVREADRVAQQWPPSNTDHLPI